MEGTFTYHTKWAWRFAKPYRAQLFLYFVLELLTLALGLLFIWWSKRTIDYAVANDTAAMKGALVYAVCSVALGMGISLYAAWLNERTRARMLINLQDQVVYTQMRATWGLTKNWHTGDIMVRVQTDCQDVVQVVGNSAIAALVTVLRILAATGFLWWMDPMLAVLLLAISPLMVFSKLYFRRFRRLNQALKQAESKLGNVIQENLRFRLSIRALNLDALRWQKIEESQEGIYAMKMSVLNFSTVSKTLMNIVVNTGFLVTFAWGVFYVEKQW